jgi:hypothetical protein
MAYMAEAAYTCRLMLLPRWAGEDGDALCIELHPVLIRCLLMVCRAVGWGWGGFSVPQHDVLAVVL